VRADIIALSLVLGLTSCSRPKDSSETVSSQPAQSQQQTIASTPTTTRQEVNCERQPFAATVDLAEASGATLLDDGSLLVIGDSGTFGAYALLDASTGERISEGKLEIDKNASDDLEGLSTMDGRIYAITSSGWMREWSVKEGSFSLAETSYALAPNDSQGLLCESAHATNCAQNYEGLCLQKRRPDAGACAGFAAAKATGRLICLQLDEHNKLHLDPSRSIQVASPRSLSGCDFDDEGRLWFGNNFFAASAIGFVEDWQSAKDAVITRVGSVGLGFPEAIALGKQGQVFRFSDTAGSPSLLSKYICR
jgi:hypothetical protein